MKAILIFCILLFVAFCFFNAIQSNDSERKPATIIDGGEQPQTSTVRPQSVSALKLFIDYQRNEVAADNIYKGRLLAVEGTVTGIRKDIFDKIYMTLATPNEFMNVQVYLDEGNESQAAALQRGEVINVVCTGGGMILGSPILKKCSFADAQDSSESVPSEPPIAGAHNTPVSQPTVQQAAETVPNDGATSPSPQNDEVGANGVRKIGGSVSAPVLVYSAEPEFTEEARKEKVAGDILVNCIVDENGFPRNVYVVRGIDKNLGLNEKAIEAVQKYRFKPAMENGKPVPVELNVQVNFQIF